MQLLVDFLGLRTLCLSFPETQVTISSLKQRIRDLEGIPTEEQRLSLCSKEVSDSRVIGFEESANLPPFRVALRILGGKGGFGSLLRGGPQGVHVKKTTNFDACRDLSGRRLRHANNEKKLKEWLAKQKDRDLQRIALEHIKKQELAEKFHFDDSKLNADSEAVRESIAAGVEEGIRQAMKKQKTEKGAVPVEEKKSEKEKEKEAESGSDDDSDEEEIDFDAYFEEIRRQQLEESKPTTTTTTSSSPSTSPEPSPKQNDNSSPPPISSSTSATTSTTQSRVDTGPQMSFLGELIDLKKYNSAKELEELGLEGLKEQLTRRGMLCGGSLTQRAERLFSVKGKSLHEIDPHLRAKTNNGSNNNNNKKRTK